MRTIALTAALLMLAGCDLLTSAETRIDRAEEAIAEGSYRAAVIELRKLLEDEPDRADARLLLAEAELGMGDPAAAESDVKRAVAGGASADKASSVQARIQLAFGRNDDLLTQIRAGELKLREPERSLYRGRALLGLRKADEALAAFQQALQAEPGSIEARVGIAEAQATAGRVTEALKDLEAITTATPTAALAWLARGGLLLQLGRHADGEQALGEALRHARAQLTEPQQLQALAGQVEARLAQGALDRAEAGVAELTSRAPSAPLTRLLRSRIAMARQDFAAAVQELTGLTSDYPGYLPARFMLGTALLAQGSLYQAERHLADVVKASPDNLEARKRLAEVRLQMNRPEAALELLSPALQGASSDARMEALLGAAQLGAGADPTAIARLEEIVARNPGDRGARLDLAALYIGRGDANRAYELLQAMPSRKGDVRREFLLIRSLAESRGQPAARAETDRLVRENPQDVELLNLAASFQLASGDAAAAAGTLGKALAVQPGHVPSLVALARARLAQGDLDAAEATYRRALSHDAGNVDARVGLAEISGRRGKPDEARRWLEEVRSGDARAIASRLLLARLYLSGQETAKAAKVVNEALEAAPGRADVLAAAGTLYLDINQPDQALGYLRRAADAEPERADLWVAIARAQTAQGFLPAARESIERALRLDPDSTAAVGLAAMLDVREGRRDAALARAEALRKRAPRDAGAAMLQGDMHAQLGQFAEAERAYAEAGRLRQGLPALVRQIQVRRQSAAADPLAPMRAWLQEHPDDLQARAMYGVFLQDTGDVEQARTQYERVVASGRPDPVSANNLAVIYQDRGDPRAEELARLAWRNAPKSGAIADTLGWILVGKGAHEEGIRVLREAAALAPQIPDIQLHLAEGLVKGGEPGEARTVLERLVAGDRPFAGRARAQELLNNLGGTKP